MKFSDGQLAKGERIDEIYQQAVKDIDAGVFNPETVSNKCYMAVEMYQHDELMLALNYYILRKVNSVNKSIQEIPENTGGLVAR